MIAKPLSNYEWLTLICGDKIHPQPWYHDRVLRLDEIRDRNIQYHEEYATLYINPKQIIGIEYGFGYNFYNDITWLYLINELYRFKEIRKKQISYESLVEHVHNDTLDDKCVDQYGDNYITRNGQHRLCLAKFLEIPLVKVNVTRNTAIGRYQW